MALTIASGRAAICCDSSRNGCGLSRGAGGVLGVESVDPLDGGEAGGVCCGGFAGGVFGVESLDPVDG
jgi:hypothetical protein